MPERPSYSGDERQVREEVMLLMKILGDSDPWDWITEKVRMIDWMGRSNSLMPLHSACRGSATNTIAELLY